MTVRKDESSSEVSRALTALDSPEWSTRRDAAVTLGRLGDRRAVPRLVALLSESRGPENTAVMQAAIDALVELGDPTAIPVLRRIAAWRDPLTLHEEEVCESAARGVQHLERPRGTRGGP